LRTENALVTEFDQNLASIASEMLLVMYASEGIGLAAPQVSKLIHFKNIAFKK